MALDSEVVCNERLGELGLEALEKPMRAKGWRSRARPCPMSSYWLAVEDDPPWKKVAASIPGDIEASSLVTPPW